MNPDDIEAARRYVETPDGVGVFDLLFLLTVVAVVVYFFTR